LNFQSSCEVKRWHRLALSQRGVKSYQSKAGLLIRLNVIISRYITFCRINKLFENYFLINKMASRAVFGPRAVVWRPVIYLNTQLIYLNTIPLTESWLPATPVC